MFALLLKTATASGGLLGRVFLPAFSIFQPWLCNPVVKSIALRVEEKDIFSRELDAGASNCLYLERDGNGGIEGNGGALPPFPPTEFICLLALIGATKSPDISI